ncbi:hypothetical protein BABINDRAFT_170404 [Babjeviella inositovora NRRL Y-12698]|uniref:N-acetyltransferase domain-containing protein n=1 Tax=Babjeviella inositovora NRRL Y-12698 TaxID=984486 RepID=A0A1E3QXF3_9ASCO|nr:uncharacterized protein BABINDRAFT_170404 [Babjeviella inositovora NRRL Y-12698]ODQ81717.1 hypothetical protein BABINDRAFT_170404 [Babjeviella inositovora NRRL Y-12698]
MRLVKTMPRVEYRKHDPANEAEFETVKLLVDLGLSEPYSIYVYRFFLTNWPDLCYLATDADQDGKVIGAIICKVEPHREVRIRGYIGMLVVDPSYRKQGIAAKLIGVALDEMTIEHKADEIMLEAEVCNGAAIALYEKFGFMRWKRLHRYYLNQHDAFRLVLPLTEKSVTRIAFLPLLECA